MPEEKTNYKEVALRAIAVLGLVAVLLLGAWGIIQIAFALPGLFGGASDLFSPSNTPAGEHLTVANPTLLTSGQAFTLSWNHTGGSGNYSYAISYSCVNGLTLQAPLPTGAMQAVPCNTPFNYTNATGNVSLTPVFTGGSQTQATFTVVADRLSDGAITATGSSTATILPGRSATAPASTPSQTTKPSSTYTTASSRPVLYGAPDLAITILSAVPSQGNYAVKFQIANVGTNIVSAGWTFSAALPENPPYTYQSQPQQALYPGDKIVYTLTFSTPNNTPNYNCIGYAQGCMGSGYPYYSGNSNVFTVTAAATAGEANTANNSASVQLQSYTY